MSEYVPPTFVDGQAPPINDKNMNDLALATSQNAEALQALTEMVTSQSETIQSLQSQLSGIISSVSSFSGAICILRNATVGTSSWAPSTTFSGFPYQANIAFQGVKSQSVVMVSFSPTDAMSGNYAPVSLSGNNFVTIFAQTAPSATITIPSIVSLTQTSS